MLVAHPSAEVKLFALLSNPWVLVLTKLNLSLLKSCWGEQKEAMLELDPLSLEGDLLDPLHPPLKKNKHLPLAIY
jgi:hypothetical protein